MLADALHLAKDRIQRVFERTVDGDALRRLELVEVGFDPLACGSTALAVAALQIPRDLFLESTARVISSIIGCEALYQTRLPS